MQNKPLQVTRIRITNFMGISDLEISPVSKFNIVEGKNGSGKTSVIDAIQKTVGEGKKGDLEFIQGGKDKTELLMELDGHILIDKRISPSGSSLSITDTTNGATIPKPQTYLSQLVGRYIVNPIQMFEGKPSEVREIFLSAIKLTLDKAKLLAVVKAVPESIDISRLNFDRHALEVIEELGTTVYTTRHQVNQELTMLDKSIQADTLRLPKEFNAEQFRGFNLQQQMAALKEARDHDAHHEADETALGVLSKRYTDLGNQITGIDEEIQRLTLKRGELEQEKQAIYADGKAMKTKVESYTPSNAAEIETRIHAYEAHQGAISIQKGIEANVERCDAVTRLHVELDSFYKAVTVELPKVLLGEADLPLDGLEFFDGEIRVNGVPLHLVNEAERLKLSVRLAKALNNGIGLMLIDGWECLDPDNQEAFIAECSQDDGFKYIVTVVGRGPLNVRKLDTIPASEPESKSSKTKPASSKKVTSGSPF